MPLIWGRAWGNERSSKIDKSDRRLKPGEGLVALQHAFDAANEARQEDSKE